MAFSRPTGSILGRGCGQGESALNYPFGRFMIPREHVFMWSTLSVAFVNLKPTLPGHVLLMPRRVVARFGDLTEEEVCDLGRSARIVSRVLKAKYGWNGSTFDIQDGSSAGQTVGHAHMHVVPRQSRDDFEKQASSQALDVGENRAPRGHDVMAAEAKEYLDLLKQMPELFEMP